MATDEESRDDFSKRHDSRQIRPDSDRRADRRGGLVDLAPDNGNRAGRDYLMRRATHEGASTLVPGQGAFH